MKKRQWFVFVVLAGLLGTLGFFGYERLGGSLPDAGDVDVGDDAVVVAAEHEDENDGSDDGDGHAPESANDDSVKTNDSALEEEPTTIRVVGLGAESIAPGIIAGGGLTSTDASEFAEVSLDVRLRKVSEVSAAERALSLGGDAEDGAHLLVLPLPSFVASYERLRALDPRIIAVAGWSQGRDALYGPASDSLMQSRRSRRSSPVALCADLGTPESFFALYLLELSGTAVRDVNIQERCGSGFRAHDRSASTGNDTGSGRLIATSADASTLVPWVIIAPGSLFEAEEAREMLKGWLHGWFEGVREIREHAAESARMIATATNSDPVRILQHLGQIQVADLAQNVQAFGLSGRGALSMTALFGETWRVWREAGVLVTPAPSQSPVDSSLVALAARASAVRPTTPTLRTSFDTPPILRVALPSERADLVHRVGWLADLFPRSAIEVQVPGSERQRAELHDELVARFGLAPERVRMTQHRPRQVVVYGVE